MSKPLASLSLDLDNKWSYLKTHGDPGWEDFPSYLDVAPPRFLRVLDQLDLRITVFVVGQDAALERNRPALASIAAAGHEIGNHSFRHEPWLQLYSDEELERELTDAEEAIEAATGARPSGFRGPGYSFSPAVLASLLRRGYRYDASTFPSCLGPVARAYYLWTARLSRVERDKRKQLFGAWSDALRPLRPYWLQAQAPGRRQPADGSPSGVGAGADRLLEIPVTTMPLLRLPIHMSYLLFLRQWSRGLAWAYWRLAMVLCRLRRVAPSLLLHPLDFLGKDDEPGLDFFPAMRMKGFEKTDFVREILGDFASRFEVLPLGEFAERIASSEQRWTMDGDRVSQPSRLVASALADAETTRQ